MKRNICPKCHGDHILKIPFYSPMRTIMTGGYAPIENEDLIQYVCRDCGYVEFWLNEERKEQFLNKYKNG